MGRWQDDMSSIHRPQPSFQHVGESTAQEALDGRFHIVAGESPSDKVSPADSMSGHLAMASRSHQISYRSHVAREFAVAAAQGILLLEGAISFYLAARAEAPSGAPGGSPTEDRRTDRRFHPR